MSRPSEIGLFVTSNKSLSHLVFDENMVTPCGLGTGLFDHKSSETRWYLNFNEFAIWVKQNRKFKDDGYRLCKKCLSAYDKLMVFG